MIAIVIGGAMVIFSDYIANQVAEGRLQIQQGQQTINTVDTLFSGSSYIKPLGKQLTKSGQKRIDRGTEQANRYESLSNQLKIGGIILIIVGLGLYCARLGL
jgi:hypothetical protein